MFQLPILMTIKVNFIKKINKHQIPNKKHTVVEPNTDTVPTTISKQNILLIKEDNESIFFSNFFLQTWYMLSSYKTQSLIWLMLV